MKLPKVHSEHLPLISTIAVCALMFALASLHYPNFFTAVQVVDFFRSNAYLGIVAIGMTLVILSGGIDLSVGAVVGFTSIFYAKLVMDYEVDAVHAIPVLLVITTLVGASMGALIHYFKIPPFLISLAGMYMYRGAALVISTSPIPASEHFKSFVGQSVWIIHQGGKGDPQIAVGIELYVFAALFLFGILALGYSTYGRSLYAIGGSEQSALLMGLPVARNKILTYAFSGLCAGLAGLVFMANGGAGRALHGSGLELDAIAVVVIGGTLLSGGAGSVWGTLFGLLIFAILNEVIANRAKDMSSAWIRIYIGILLLAFILLQKLLQYRRRST